MLTEYEWRRQSSGCHRRKAELIGAQCVFSVTQGQKLMKDRAFHAFLLLVSVTFAILLPILVQERKEETFHIIESSQTNSTQPRIVSTVSYQTPPQLEYVQRTFTRRQLAEGRMMLIDREHPLPDDVPYPNTMSIAIYGKGRVPVQSLQLKSGRETIDALVRLFAALQSRKVNGLSVWDATQSVAEQQERLAAYTRNLMKLTSPDTAVSHTLTELDWPGSGEMQQEYTVEIRPVNMENHASWQTLLQTAWRYGFVRTDPNGMGRLAYRFRWVGEAHATAMTYLNLSLKDYLLWLHEKGCIVIEEHGKPQYVILCQPVKGTHTAFSLPADASFEASLDNMGYAVVACTLP